MLQFMQLEVLDTAGAEQFTSLNEVYIKVGAVLTQPERVDERHPKVWSWLHPSIQASSPCRTCSPPLTETFYSLTQEASLKEVDNLRKQIYRIKGGDTVSRPP